ncbi:hypothetical protein [Citricoccus sp. NR2]|uniref:hypothetical protein n=1 Tax=Citricoccus sp. NR2 TaxID=3004095 RepID=UPI0022DE2945|nr:hypothetical protein [Citricoccus sp. NR2]WBL19758.1 hypothetical protein O1A05_03420 [Citricoccus sp. NR2]
MPTSTVIPSRPTDPTNARSTRITITVIAALTVLLSLGGLGASSIAAAVDRADFEEIPLRQSIGTPTSLDLDSGVGSVRVQVSEAVDEIELGLVDRGSTTLTDTDETTQGHWEISEEGTGSNAETSVTLQRPNFQGNIGWALGDSLDLLVVIPTELSESLDLSVRNSVGNIEASGSFERLHVSTNVGNINLPAVSASEEIVAQGQVGQLQIGLTEDHRADVIARLDVGNVDVTVPCCEAWSVRATNEVGELDVDSDLREGSGPTIVARTNVGDVTVERR